MKALKLTLKWQNYCLFVRQKCVNTSYSSNQIIFCSASKITVVFTSFKTSVVHEVSNLSSLVYSVVIKKDPYQAKRKCAKKCACANFKVK